MDKFKILVVEDEADIREAMVDALLTTGSTILSAKDGQEGLATALAEQPDLILLDLVMPNMTGNEVLKKLRQDPWGRSVKVIILTAMDDVQNVATTHEYKISDYIIKTHNSLSEILNKVREVLHTD